MLSNPLYKRDSTGKVRVWFYEVEGNSYRTHAGIKDGTIVVSDWTVCVAASQNTDEEQALFEAKALYDFKTKRTYHEDIATIDTPIIFEPMLAKEYSRERHKVKFPVIAQPKLDGIRCIGTAKGLFTRQGKPITAVPHIEEALDSFFASNPDVTLDGELYNHDLKDDFNQITSIVRRQSNTDLDLAKSEELIQYHIYDAFSATLSWTDRNGPMRNWAALHSHPSIELVDTKIVYEQDDLDRLYTEWMALGYEGQMVRRIGVYVNKRSDLLLKRKEFMSEEFTIVDILPGLGNWAGYGKRLVCKLPDGREFGAGVKGTQSTLEQYLKDSEEYVGGTATVKFFQYTPDGIPRFPVAIDLHKSGRVD